MSDTSRFGVILTFTISSNRSFSDNLGQNSWDKSQNCTTSVFDSVPPASPVSMLVESNAIRPYPNIELGGKGDEKVLNVCFDLGILGNMTKTQKFASVPIYFDQDCRYNVFIQSRVDYAIEIGDASKKLLQQTQVNQNRIIKILQFRNECTSTQGGLLLVCDGGQTQ